MSEQDERFQAICAGRDAFWEEWGDVDPDLLVPLVNPAFQGFPTWPGLRQAYRIVRRGSLTLLATEGLADPCEDDEETDPPGLGLEFFAVTKDDMSDGVQGSWLVSLLMQVSMSAAEHGGMRDLIERYGTISLECHDVPVPAPWRTERETVGVLLNVPDRGGAGVLPVMAVPPVGVLAVAVKLLTPAEIAFAEEQGPEGRATLATRFQAAGHPQRSGLSRASVV